VDKTAPVHLERPSVRSVRAIFIARTVETGIHPQKQDSHVVAHRWWTLSQLLSSTDEFAPQRLGELIAAIIRGDYPDPPIDCGI